MRTCILILLMSLSFITVTAQEPNLKLTVLGGSSVSFHVNSLKKWDEGVTLEGWIRLRIRFNDENVPPVSRGWILTVKAEQESIEFDGNGVDMDLSLLQIRVDDVESLSGNSYNGGGISSLETLVDDPPIELLSDDQIEDIDLLVTISCELGTDPSSSMRLADYATGYYTVNLIFTLEPIEL